MAEYKLTLEKRELTGKKLKALRDSGMIPSVVYGGKEPVLATSEYVATEKVLTAAGYHSAIDLDLAGKKTLAIVKDVQIDPDSLAGIVFLSGGQTVDQATDNLAAVIKNGPFPWPITFSFARALQDPALFTWKGDNANSDAARQAFLARLQANTAALQP